MEKKTLWVVHTLILYFSVANSSIWLRDTTVSPERIYGPGALYIFTKDKSANKHYPCYDRILFRVKRYTKQGRLVNSNSTELLNKTD